MRQVGRDLVMALPFLEIIGRVLRGFVGTSGTLNDARGPNRHWVAI